MKYSISVDYCTPGDIAMSLGLTDRTVYRWINQGKLPYYRIERKIYIGRKEFDEFLQKHLKPSKGDTTEKTRENRTRTIGSIRIDEEYPDADSRF